MLFSGLPPVVREEDKFEAVATLRNASEQKQTAQVSATVTASTRGALGKTITLPMREVSLKPGQAEELILARDHAGQRRSIVVGHHGQCYGGR